MKIIIAPDSFKDSLSAEGVAQAIAEGLAQVWPDAHVIQCPMADGGEGTVDAVLAACNGELRRQTVCGPLGGAVEARWGWLADSHTALIEMAEASGLQLVPPGQRDACSSTTFGTGELIRAALDAGPNALSWPSAAAPPTMAAQVPCRPWACNCSMLRTKPCRPVAWPWPTGTGQPRQPRPASGPGAL
jgi:hypothetical protein